MNRLPKVPARIARARGAVTAFVLFGGLSLVLLAGAALLGPSRAATAQAWMAAGLHGPWALPVAVIGFTALAFLGVPQIVLVAAAAVALGPWLGFVYSWVANLAACVAGFYVGRKLGARGLREHAGEGVRRFVEMIGRNGFWASLIVRLVPSAPFVVVNMAAGVTPMRLRDFVAGTALGSVPKIALTVFAGHAAIAAISGGGWRHWAGFAFAVLVWVAAGLATRAWFRRNQPGPNPVSQAGSEPLS